MLQHIYTFPAISPRSSLRSSYLNKLNFFIFIFYFFILSDVVLAKESKKDRISDIRVLVDISGSMKKTDPNNLRRPAIRLLAGLIPAGSRSGIWNFGKQVNMAVKIGSVNEAWRALAREQSKKISSVGLYTNIESAMRKASFDWKKPDSRYKRNLILLTDGHVDISKDNNQDKASRKRILKEILPALEKAKVRIHTIALSDDVDESLFSTLSAYTDGLYKKVNSADDLHKLFLQMLEQSVKLDTLPLKNNQFNVDVSVNDMTLLIFNKNISEPTRLVTPDKKTWNEKSNSSKTTWFRDDGFDLITIKKPQQGQWKIISPEDKNNRVVVATNLKLKVNDLPGHLMFGDVVKVSAHLQEDGKPLIDKKLLSKFDFSIRRKIGDDEKYYEMSRPEKNKNISEYQISAMDKEGVNELVISAKSPTVEREVRHQFKVYATPAEIKVSEKEGLYKIKVTPYANLLRLDSVKVNIVLEDKSTHELVRNNNEWLFNVESKFKHTPFTLNINAKRADEKNISMSFNKVLVLHNDAQGLKLSDEKNVRKILLSNKTKVNKNNPSHDISAEDDSILPDKVEAGKKETDMSWPMIIGLVAAGNIILIAILGAGYIFIRKRKARMTKDVSDQIGDIDAGESKAEEVETER